MEWYRNFNEMAAAHMTSEPNLKADMSVFNMGNVKTAPPFRGFRFYTWTDEEQYGGKLEPPHVHVDTKGSGEAKIWLGASKSEVQLAENHGVAGHVVNDIVRHVAKYRQNYMDHWVEAVEKPYNQNRGEQHEIPTEP